MNAQIILVIHEVSTSLDYVIVAVISLFILGYLLYSLIRPERF
jgi:K+-transporting ATPase KdpF subunit